VLIFGSNTRYQPWWKRLYANIFGETPAETIGGGMKTYQQLQKQMDKNQPMA